MAFYLLLLIAAVACLSALGSWRQGVVWMILLAAIQDPLRKLVPGAPGALLLLVSAVFIATALGLLSARSQAIRQFQASFPAIRKALGWFLLSLLPPLLISLFYGPGSWKFSLFGVLSYGSLLVSVLVGFYFLRSERDLRRLIGFYCVLSTIMLSGTFIEYLDLPGFGELVGTKALDFSWIRYNEDYTVKLIAGFYRSPDVMGWHASAAAILSLLLAFTGRAAGRWNWLAITTVAIAALMVSGRRKMVFMVPFFIVITLFLLLQSRRKGLDFQSLLLIAAPMLIGLSVGDWLGSDSEFIRYYTYSGGELISQTQRHGWDSVLTTYEQNGFWGFGLGFASPGAQNIAAARPYAWQESGPSRVMAELGVPGFVLLLGLLLVVIRACIHTTRALYRQRSPYSDYAVGLLAFVLANFASLTISGQILADPFIATFIGIAIGLQLSLPRLAAIDASRALQPATAASELHPVAPLSS